MDPQSSIQNDKDKPATATASPVQSQANKEFKPEDLDPNLSAFDLLSKSFDIVKKYWQTFIIVNILSVLSAFTAFVPQDEEKINEVAESFSGSDPIESVAGNLTGLEIGAIAGFGLVFLIVILVLFAYFQTANIIAQTRASKGEAIETGKVLSDTWGYLFRIIAVSFISGIIIVIGLLLLIVPGIIAIARLSLAPFIVVDKNAGVFEAIKESNAYGKKYFSKIWAVILVGFVVGIATGIIGAIPFLGSLAATVIAIFLSLIMPLRYFQLKKLEGAANTDKTQPTSTSFPVSPAKAV